jgi:hypothetical protein
MSAITYRDPIPAMLGALDGQAIHAAAQDADDLKAEREAQRREMTVELSTLVDNGDPSALVQGVPWPLRGGVVMAVTLSDALYESLDTKDMDFRPVAAYLLERAVEGDEQAQKLLDRMVAAYVESQL